VKRYCRDFILVYFILLYFILYILPVTFRIFFLGGILGQRKKFKCYEQYNFVLLKLCICFIFVFFLVLIIMFCKLYFYICILSNFIINFIVCGKYFLFCNKLFYFILLYFNYFILFYFLQNVTMLTLTGDGAGVVHILGDTFLNLTEIPANLTTSLYIYQNGYLYSPELLIMGITPSLSVTVRGGYTGLVDLFMSNSAQFVLGGTYPFTVTNFDMDAGSSVILV
jgi:hypothetical protein